VREEQTPFAQQQLPFLKQLRELKNLQTLIHMHTGIVDARLKESASLLSLDLVTVHGPRMTEV
jgi:hypothetical protein